MSCVPCRPRLADELIEADLIELSDYEHYVADSDWANDYRDGLPFSHIMDASPSGGSEPEPRRPRVGATASWRRPLV
jgi:hypothetical protein